MFILSDIIFQVWQILLYLLLYIMIIYIICLIYYIIELNKERYEESWKNKIIQN